MKTRALSIVAFLALLFATLPPASAWTRKGHAAIANIADANLTPAVRAKVDALLEHDLNSRGFPSGRTRLADIATWADEIRAGAPDYTYRGWHTRGNPVCENRLGGCRRGACVDQKLLHYAAILKDSHAPQRERNEALKWVVHLVGDLHTPPHSGSNYDAAGNIPARFKGWDDNRETTLHWLWDRELANAALQKGPIVAILDKQASLSPDAVMRWMLETKEVSRKHVYEPLPGFVCGAPYSGPVTLDHAYQQQAIIVIRQQIERAGLRLALLLNALLK